MARSGGSSRQEQNKRINFGKILGGEGEKRSTRILKAAFATRRKASAPMATQFN